MCGFSSFERLDFLTALIKYRLAVPGECKIFPVFPVYYYIVQDLKLLNLCMNMLALNLDYI